MKSIWNEVREHLQNKRDGIRKEIGAYPTPIAGCDQQFNYLLEQRTRISRELARFDEAENACPSTDDSARALDAFLNSSSQVDAPITEDIRLRLKSCISDSNSGLA
jgi:hypothetical protein